MGQDFSRRLAAARRAAGFKTAYAFYHGNGGRRHFPFTYVHYLRLENRGRLPQAAWLQPLISALRLSPGDSGCRELFLAYLKDLLGEAPARLVLAPLLGAAPQASGADAAKWLAAEHTVHLTPEQFAAIAEDECVYWCSEALLNDSRSWTVDELSKRLGRGVKDTRAAAERLVAAGLAKRAGARYRGRWRGKLFTFPGRLAGMAAAFKRIRGYWEKMARRSGAEIGARVELVRSEDAFIRRYAANLAQTVESAGLGAVHAPGDDTALYLVEARVRRLMPL